MGIASVPLTPTTVEANVEAHVALTSDAHGGLVSPLGMHRVAEMALPAFTAGALTVNPGVDKVNAYVIVEGREEPADSTVSIGTTGSPPNGVYLIACYALALGHTVTVANDGPAGGNLGTFSASMTKEQSVIAYFDGANFIAQGTPWLFART